MRKKARTTSSLRAELLRTRRNNDFTVDVESQRPARKMARNTLRFAGGEKSILLVEGF
jgi:hypothetical protein